MPNIGFPAYGSVYIYIEMSMPIIGKLSSQSESSDPHTVTTTDRKTNMRHIHTYIVSRHLATKGNN